MSRYPPPEYRGPRDRSRSPPRFSDRRPSAASIFDNRPPGPPRNASDAPRGPRSQFDSTRPPLTSGLSSGSVPRPGYGSLRDAPALGTGDRGRSYREREYDRRDRPPSPRERSPPRNFKDSRDYPPRDLDVGRARRDSRDVGPPSATSNFSDGQPYSSSGSFRGGPSRGRGRGDYSFRGGRGGRPNLDDRDVYRRERSPPPRWGRDPSRESREPERRPDDRRFERREDERRPSEWADRERDRDLERNRREPLPPRLESRVSNESMSSSNAAHQPSSVPPINPARLAMIESSVGDTVVRRSSIQSDVPPRRDQPETPSYLNGRAETTANRYGSRGSSPPTQAPPVPAFTLSFASSAATAAPSTQPFKTTPESKVPSSASNTLPQDVPKPAEDSKPEPPAHAPIAPRAPPPAPKAQLVSPPAAAPRAPRAHEVDEIAPPANRLQGVRSLESLPFGAPSGPGTSRTEASTNQLRPAQASPSPANAPALPTLTQPVSPGVSQSNRFADLAAPTGPRASRMSPAQASVSPRPPFASPRSDIGSFQSGQGQPRMQTPPPTAPSGPRNRSYSVSPKVASSNVPTAPKANRGPPLAPRGADRGPMPPGRTTDRFGQPQGLAPPTAPRGPQWNQWRRHGAPGFPDKTVPAKRDHVGEEKGRPAEQSHTISSGVETDFTMKSGERSPRLPNSLTEYKEHQVRDQMEIDKQPPRRQTSMMSGQSAAHQSFFGKPANEQEEDTSMSDTGQELPSTSEDDESDLENDLTLFNAKFERQKRQLQAQMVDLSTRHYRATTPLESIARLSRISTRDLQRFQEQREHDMDVDGSPVAHSHPLLPTTRSSDSGEGPGLQTPKGEDNHRVAIRSSEGSSEGMPRVRRPTPEPVNLPYLLKDAQLPFNEIDAFKDTVMRHEDSKADVLYAMEEVMLAEDEDEADNEDAFAEQYRKWREECEDLDKFKEEQERMERQQSLEHGPEIDVPPIPPSNPVFEGRRLHKYSSEYDVEQVLKQSEETARIEQEKQDREARKNQADMEKEAKVPDQQTNDEIRHGVFIDSNRYREPESLTVVFSYQPPADNFTEEEQHIFIAAFKETPKKWGEIASLLYGRTYEDCIRHYYANKWDGRFRDNRTKKLKAGGRRGRGGARAPRGRIGGLMADLARTEDLMSPEMSEKGRPRRAAAPTTFAEKEAEAKASLLGPSPAKKVGNVAKTDSNSEAGPEKPGKRQKRTGEKPGRKAKSTQPLAAIAPQASPGKPYLPGVHSKEELARVQKLEDASLLASIQTGHPSMMSADGNMVYSQEGYIQAVPPPEEPGRSKIAGQGAPAKQSASSYWSVPEQNDFFKYIGHFGRDFGAIAAHMGTKTQTMIKNHYQRQVDGGNRPELEKAAIEADDRRARGEDIGPPPLPTPMQKRKYDNPQTTTQRPLAPHSEGMDIDETGPEPRAQVPKHTSPPQYPPDLRFTTSSRDPALTAPRVAPSPLLTSGSAATSQVPATSHSKPMQHPLGSRITFLPDTRNESRPAAPPVATFRAPQETPQRSQHSQPSRTIPDAPDQQFIQNLQQEKERALRLQKEFGQQPERLDQMQMQHQTAMHRHPSQNSPPNHPMHNPPDRKPISEERPMSPPRPLFSGSNLSRPPATSAIFGNLGQAPFSSLHGRTAFNASSPKREDSRPSSVPNVPPAPATAAPSEPKRSNVLSLLNSEPEEPKPTKRESLPSVAQRTTSPQGYSHATSVPSSSSVPALRREPSFGQPSLPQSHFQRNPFGQQSSTPVPTAPPLKSEHSSGSASLSQHTKPDWARHVLAQANQPSPPTPTLEREVRPYFNHRSLLGSVTQSRMNPSPPPMGAIDRSRRPSLTAQPGQHSRDQSQSSLLGQPQSAGQHSTQSLQPNPYASQQPSGFSHQQHSQSHHSHNSSVGSPFSGLHHRTISRDDQLRQEHLSAQLREEDERRWRQPRDNMAMDRRRDEQYGVQRQIDQDRERERHQNPHRAPPQPLQPPSLSSTAFSPTRSLDLRGQSRMETEMAMRQEVERQRQQQQGDERRRDVMMRDRGQEEYLRRQDESLFQRRTPLGGSYGLPPSASRR